MSQMEFYNAARKAFPAQIDVATLPAGMKVDQLPSKVPTLRDGTPGFFWDRQLKHANPLRFFNSETRSRFTALRQNYARYHLFRPKGILSVALVYGGSGWLAGVAFKQRFHYQYKYH